MASQRSHPDEAQFGEPRVKEGMPRAPHNLMQDIALECNYLTLYRPDCYRCLPYLLDDRHMEHLHLRFLSNSLGLYQVFRIRAFRKSEILEICCKYTL